MLKSIKKTRKLIHVFFVVLAGMLLCSCSEDPSFKTAEYKGSITIGYYPGSYLNEPVVNVIKAAANSLGLKVYLKSETDLTWQADLHNDEIDIMIDEKNDTDMLSDVIFTTRVLFVKHDNANLDDGGLIGVLDVGFIRESAQAITDFHNARYSYYAIPEMLTADFESGLLDGIIVNEVDYLRYCNLPDEDVDFNVINTRDVYLVFEQGDNSLMEAFNQKLVEYKDSGVLQELVYAN